MKSTLYSIILKLRIMFISAIGNKLDRILIRVSDIYYSSLQAGKIHEDIIASIIKKEYPGDKKIYDDCIKFIYSTKLPVDGILEHKYGRSSRFILHLFKLVLKIHLNSIPDNEKLPYNEELNTASVRLNKHFNKIILFMFEKYPIN